MLLQTANMVIIARLLTPAEVGVFIIALSLVTIIQALREMGLTNYLIREPVLQDASIRTIFGMSIVLCAVIALALLLLRHPLESWFGVPGLAQVMFPIAFVIAIFPIEQPAMALIRRDMRFETLHHISISAKFAGVATSITLAFAGFSTMALVWGLVAESVLRTMLLARAERRPLRLGPSLENWKMMMGFGSWLTGASLAGQASLEVNKLMVGSILGAGPAGLFDRAVRIPGMVAMAVFMPLGRVLLSSFSEDVRRGQSLGSKIARVTAITTGIAWPLFTVLAVLSHEIVLFVLGPNWAEAATILPWLLLSQIILTSLMQPDQILVPHGMVRRLFILRILQMLTSLGTGWVALQWGLQVFAMSRPLIALITVAMTWFAIAKYMNLNTGQIIQIYLQSALVSLATVLPIILWKFGGVGHGSIIALMGCLAGSACLAFVTLYVLKHPVMDEMGRLRRLVSRSS